MIRWCIFISGRGSNLSAAIEECRESGPQISLVVSSDKSAAGLARARRAGIPTISVPLLNSSRDEKPKIDWQELDLKLRSARIDAIFLLGFMKIVPASFLEKWKGRVLNLHPSLLPQFPGLRSIERAIEAGAPLGATVHVVEPKVDSGPIIKQTPSPFPQDHAMAEFLVHVSEQILVKNVFSRMHFIRRGEALWS